MKYLIFLAISVFSKISVPIFFMISGALMLRKDYSMKQIFEKVYRIFIALVLFSFLSYLQLILYGSETFNPLRFTKVLLTENWMNVFWYLYAYMALLLTIPFMRALVKGMDASLYRYLIILAVILNLLPLLTMLIGDGSVINKTFSVQWIINSYPLYPLVGYFYENILDINKVTKKHLSLLWILSILSIVLMTIVQAKSNVISQSFNQAYINSLVIIEISAVYLTAKKVFSAITLPEGLAGCISLIGSLTFGIYLFHGLLLRSPIGIWAVMKDHVAMNLFIKCIIRIFEIMIIAGLLTWICKKIPYLKKLF